MNLIKDFNGIQSEEKLKRLDPLQQTVLRSFDPNWEEIKKYCFPHKPDIELIGIRFALTGVKQENYPQSVRMSFYTEYVNIWLQL